MLRSEEYRLPYSGPRGGLLRDMGRGLRDPERLLRNIILAGGGLTDRREPLLGRGGEGGEGRRAYEGLFCGECLLERRGESLLDGGELRCDIGVHLLAAGGEPFLYARGLREDGLRAYDRGFIRGEEALGLLRALLLDEGLRSELLNGGEDLRN